MDHIKEKLKRHREILNAVSAVSTVSTEFLKTGQDHIANSSEGSGQDICITTLDERSSDYENTKSLSDIESDDQEEPSDYNKNLELRYSIKNWALDFNISHAAVNSLLEILNKRISDVLPKDARTLLDTNKEILHISDSAPGHYWHNGLIKCLKKIYDNVSCLPHEISLNINVDGLPVFNSSRYQFWPILCTIFEIPNLAPFVVG